MVILTREAYTAEMQRILQDPSTCRKLLGNPTIKLKSSLNLLIQKGSKLGKLHKKEARYLLPKVPKIPVIYQIPKDSQRTEYPTR